MLRMGAILAPAPRPPWTRRGRQPLRANSSMKEESASTHSGCTAL
jgi:hypothetical protein